ncbi:MAG: hypothetical protein HY870_12960 [Chloroflexi bacterium]|nr:hypothetical protein [Chloroflexota bacterium]
MRSKPAFKPDSSQYDSPSCLWMFIVAVGGYFAFGAINRVLSGYGNRLDHLICYGVLIGFVILVILAKRQTDRDTKKLREAHHEWKYTCRSAEVSIINRQHYPGGSWEDGYGIPHSSHPSYHLNLELTAEQRVLFPNLQSVRVDVNEDIYSKLIDRNVVRVYYQPDSPMIFLMEEEIE